MDQVRRWYERNKTLYRRRRDRWLAETIVRLVALPGRMKLSRDRPVRILIDNCVLRHGLTHTNAWISTGPALWGDQAIGTGYRARVPRDYREDQKDIYEEQIPYFAPLAHLARLGFIRLFTSDELIEERARQPGYNRFMFGYNVWDKVEIETLPSIATKPTTERAVHWSHLREYSSAKAQTQRILETCDDEFLRLFGKVSAKTIPDAFHIWTAKQAGCSVFLTTDGKCCRTAKSFSKSQSEAISPVQVLQPSDFAKSLGLGKVPHYVLTPLDSDWFYEMREPQVRAKRLNGD